MGRFRAWLSNPNVHLAGSLLLGLISCIPIAAPFAPVIQAVGLTLTGTGLVLPEGGSMHAVDYEKLATSVADGVKAAVAALPSRA